MQEQNTLEDNIIERGVKVILLGIQQVGKTNLINIATDKGFKENTLTTSTSSYSILTIKLNNKRYQLNLWDTIGQEKYRQLTKLFYNNSKIVIFVYDITSRKSFEDLALWHKEVIEQIGDNIIKGVVANKMDLYEDEKVLRDEGEDFAKSINAKFLAMSAKQDQPDKFKNYLKDLLSEYLNLGIDDERNFRITLYKDDSKGNNRKKCC